MEMITRDLNPIHLQVSFTYLLHQRNLFIKKSSLLQEHFKGELYINAEYLILPNVLNLIKKLLIKRFHVKWNIICKFKIMHKLKRFKSS